MSNRFFEPLKRIPQKFQNLGFVQKFQDKIYRPDEAIQMNNTSNFGMMSDPTCFDFDAYLSLLSIGTKSGQIHVYGAPGISFSVNAGDFVISSVKFIPNEGRIVALTQDNCLLVFSLDAKMGKWVKTYSCYASTKPNEYATCMCYNNGIIYVGYDTGNVHQFPIKDGKICVGSEEERLVSLEKAIAGMTFDDRDDLDLNSPIISLEVDRDGDKLLMGYKSGTVAVATISPETPVVEEKKASETGSAEKKDVPAKLERSESNLLRKSRTMTMNLKNSFYGENKTKDILFEPFKIPMPPVPVVNHFFSLQTEITSASWYYSKEDESSIKIVTTYEDGSFRLWTFKPASEAGSIEIVEKEDSRSIPYGPTPCNSMEKIIHHTSKDGEILEIFSGGLNKNIKSEASITIIKNASQFGFGFASNIIDFILVPENKLEEINQNEKHKASSSHHDARYLFVLTEKEFHVIDLLPKECKVLENPYLSCIDFSPITCVNFVEDVESSLIQSLVEGNSLLSKDYISYDKWPIVGGAQALGDHKVFSKNNILFLGHEDGCVSMWQVDSSNCIRNLGIFFIYDMYNTTQEIINDNWPFFNKIGMSQLYERIEMTNDTIEPSCHAIRSLEVILGESNFEVIIGAENGHVSMWSSHCQGDCKFEPDVALKQIDLMAEEKDCTFENNTPAVLPLKEGVFTPSAIANKRVLPFKVAQLLPVSRIRKIDYNKEWDMMAFATDYGFALFNNAEDKVVGSMFTPKPPAMPEKVNGTDNVKVNGDAKVNGNAKGGKNIKSSIRSSFKKIKKTKPQLEKITKTDEDDIISTSAPLKEDEEKKENDQADASQETIQEEIVEEKKVNGHSAEEEKATEEPVHIEEEMKLFPAPVEWHITSLIFTNGPLKSIERSSPVLIAGSGNGSVLIYDIEKIIIDGQTSGMVLHKELHLQHGAPVVELFMIDQKTHCPVSILPRYAMMIKEVPESKPVEEKEEKKEDKKEEKPATTEEAEGEKKDQPEAETEKKPIVTEEKIKAPEICQDLLVVSEEQMKIFNFTTLLPKQKYKFIDRTIRLGNLGLTRQPSVTNGTHPADESKVEIETSPDVRKRILSASIKQVPDELNPEHLHHYILVNLADGNVCVHSLPYLRRQAKQLTGHISASSLTGLRSYSCLSAVGSQLVLTEFVNNKYKFKANQISVIQLPEWSRPNLATVITEAINKTLDNVNDQIVKPTEDTVVTAKEKIVTEVQNDIQKIGQVVNENNESGKKVLSEICTDINDSMCKINGGTTSLGDITMDTVKEYVQTDGVINIKTSETSIEKRTIIKGGDISTVVRETELVDGKVIKDDITKMKSPSTITENGQQQLQEIPSN